MQFQILTRYRCAGEQTQNMISLHCRYFKCISFVSIFFGVFCVFGQPVSNFPKLLIISMDGFRHDYVEACLTPAIIRLRATGVYAPFLRNVFPTKTFPNHHSIATGVHPDVHGVLDSSVYAPKDGCSNRSHIGYSYELYHYDNDVLPIWTLNQMSSKKRHSGVMMWPGGEFPYGCKKTLPTFIQKLDFNISFHDRVDTVISWFTHPETPANLVMLYFDEPDLHGHAFGVEASETRQKIKNLDEVLDYASEQLKRHSIHNITVFVLSDHGMISLNQKNIIDLNHYIDNETFTTAGSSPVLQIFPHEGKEDIVLSNLREARIRNKGTFDVFTRNEIPGMWHYATNNRTPPILVVAKEGYAFQDFFENIEYYNKKFDIDANPRNKYGIHGYTNALSKMHPLFFAWGPLVKSGEVLEPFDVTELYSVWTHLLGLDEQNSSLIPNILNLNPLIRVNNITRTHEYSENLPTKDTSHWTYWFAGLIAGTLFLALIGLLIHIFREVYFRKSTEFTLSQHQRGGVEDQHLLSSESDNDIRL